MSMGKEPAADIDPTVNRSSYFGQLLRLKPVFCLSKKGFCDILIVNAFEETEKSNVLLLMIDIGTVYDCSDSAYYFVFLFGYVQNGLSMIPKRIFY